MPPQSPYIPYPQFLQNYTAVTCLKISHRLVKHDLLCEIHVVSPWLSEYFQSSGPECQHILTIYRTVCFALATSVSSLRLLTNSGLLHMFMQIPGVVTRRSLHIYKMQKDLLLYSTAATVSISISVLAYYMSVRLTLTARDNN